MTVFEDLNRMMRKAVSNRDLRQLETISQTVFSFISYPHKHNSIKVQSENRKLEDLFNKISVYIIYLTNHPQKFNHGNLIKRRG